MLTSLTKHILMIRFVLLNSMALEGDGCALCKKAEQELKQVSSQLKCLHKDKIMFNFWRKQCELAPLMSDPILLQVRRCTKLFLLVLCLQ